jgi:glycosyltransferase involved in cell wall biosynthesis
MQILYDKPLAGKKYEATKNSMEKSSLISVIIPCYNHAHYLEDAIGSVLEQHYGHYEIIVVDDGSADNTAEVAGRFPEVKYVRQPNAGLSAARNTGIRHSEGDFLVFLDADDWLMPNALEVGLKAFALHPECAFVCGSYRFVREDRSPIGESVINHVTRDHYAALLKNNFIGMHATVMYRREAVESLNGFDTTLSACEDYDIYLRIARNNPIFCHPEIVADYRRHTTNMSSDNMLMLKKALAVHERQWPYVQNYPSYREAYKEGRRYLKELYTGMHFRRIKDDLNTFYKSSNVYKNIFKLARTAPDVFVGKVFRKLPYLLYKRYKTPPVGSVRFGDLRRVTPVSTCFGYDRGGPVDRYYIDKFLAKNRADIKGRVLEIGDNTYTIHYGGRQVTQSDVLHVNENNAAATFVGDLTDAPHVPSDAFDCVIITQTFHLIYDVKAALRTCYRVLNRGAYCWLPCLASATWTTKSGEASGCGRLPSGQHN